jgi:queuine/archaeosine tRNA-ribosyltransferase
MEVGLRAFLGVPDGVRVLLDNGSFYFLRRDGDPALEDYEAFVHHARPDWYPVPRDVIPHPQMTPHEQQACLNQTMRVNLRYRHDGYVPVIHASPLVDQYILAITTDEQVSAKPALAIGGIVPNLLRMPKARPYDEVIAGLRRVRTAFADKHLHLFGIGGTATLHIAALLHMDSVDSSGWRNRAARGIVQLPGTGDRSVADLGSWRGRAPSPAEWQQLRDCPCPACRLHGIEGLVRGGIDGFCNRSLHNLWTLIEETRLIESHLQDGTYRDWYQTHLDNTIYRPLIDRLLALRSDLIN